ncbi:MAG TPA: TIM-barrel domain-containing protein [Solirubrobacteraceae bacterium]|nr:TIM-barrel domain-containing protein [Solirubrobacteraceae bacterium]
MLDGLHPWAVDGSVHDRFLRITEGVVADERLGPAERPVASRAIDRGAHELTVLARLDGGRELTWRLALEADGRLVAELAPIAAGAAPLRLATSWDGRGHESFAGLGARHEHRVDHGGRAVQLGAGRVYRGPDCTPEILAVGGIPQGDYAPAPWAQSSAGYAVWLQGHGNGTRFDLGTGPLVTVSARSVAGPLRLHVLTDATPAARLRRYLRLTGVPPVQPEWGYGFWKSRDVHEHQDAVLEDVHGCRWHGVPLDAIVIDSPWETQYNTWEPNPHQFPEFEAMVRRLRADGVRTVVWVTPWVNVESRDGQVPPDPGSRRLHAEPASNQAEGEAAGHYVRDADGGSLVARWWMGTGSPVDLLDAGAERWWREQAKGVLALGVEGIKADDGEGYYVPDDATLARGTRTGGEAAWALGGAYRRSMRRALDEVHPGDGVLFGRCGWSGQQADGFLWAGDQVSDFWSLRALVAATISAAASGFSNWSHDVGGYLGQRLTERCPPELLVRWAQLGCFTPLMQAHGRLRQEPWTYDPRTLALYRGYALLHEMLVPYIRAAAATCERAGVPIVRPLHLLDPADPRAWTVADAFGFGPALWVAPVLEEGARERRAPLPRGRWVEAWSGAVVEGGGSVTAPAPLHAIPVWVREGSLVVTYPAEHVAHGLGDTPAAQRPLVATLWGEPPTGRATCRLADGTVVRRRDGGWSVAPERDVAFRVAAVRAG